VTRNSIKLCRVLMQAAAVAGLLAIVATHGVAQSASHGGPTLFKQNPNERELPVRITSATLEVRDKEKKATFNGDVHVVQGDTELRSSVLVVFYENDPAHQKAKKETKAETKSILPAPPGGNGNQRISRMEARGSVIMTQKDQRAVGDQADFDVVRNTMLLTGNVVVTRGEDVLRGKKLNVDLTTGIYTMESDGGRVEVLISRKSGQSLTPPTPSPKTKRTN